MSEKEFIPNSAHDKTESNNLEILLDEREIEWVFFDLDSTLIDTDQYYISAINNGFNIFCNKYPHKEADPKIFSDMLFSMYRRNNYVPQLITYQIHETALEYAKERGIEINEEEFKKEVKELYEDFYTTSPEIFHETIEVMHKIIKAGRKIAIHTHAQTDWTEIKIEKIKKAYQERYGEDLELLVHITPLEKKKDHIEWLETARKAEADIRRVLVVGDNLTADIIASLQAGFINAIHIGKEEKSQHLRTLLKDYIKNLYVGSIANIKDLLS